MIFRIKKKYEAGFKLWLEKLGYIKKNLQMAVLHFQAKAHARC